MIAISSHAVETRHDDEDASYSALLASMVGINAGPLFTTDAASLYDVFLDALPPGRRQHYECRPCRTFVDRFGGLVTIEPDGQARSLLWNAWTAPAVFFAGAIRAVAAALSKAKVTGVFLSSEKVWGVPSTKSAKSPSGAWHHMHIVPDVDMVHRPTVLLTSAKVMAEKVHDYGMLQRGLAEFPVEIVQQAHTLLTTGGLYRSEKCIGVAKWLLDLHEARLATKHKVHRENLVWRAVATAPAGFPHVRTTMIATLFEDIVARKDFANIKRSFDAKMAPLQYMRPQAAPTDGQLAAAESIIAKLGAAGALARRYARLEDVVSKAIWTPKPPSEPSVQAGVFDHLRKGPKTQETIDVPTQTLTWEKFRRTVLPTAQKIEMLVPDIGNFFAFVTAVNHEAPPILQWDIEGRRNPVSWYLYNGGSPATRWKLAGGSYVDVDAITLQPTLWGIPELAGASRHGDGAHFILRGSADTAKPGLALFPEILKNDFHGIRSAIEAFSAAGKLDGAESASACGLCLQQSGQQPLTVRVAIAGARVLYRIDRWD
jgi:hypothetical protein